MPAAGLEASEPPAAAAPALPELELECFGTGDGVSCALAPAPAPAPPATGEPAALWPPLALLLLVAPFALWGTSMAALKLVLPSTTPLFVASVRLIPSGAALLLFCALRGKAQPKTGAAWAALCVFGLVDGTAFQGCLAEGLQRTTAGLGSVIIDSQPLTVACLASLFFNEPVGPLGVAGLVLGVAGLVLLELPPGGVGDLLAAAGSAPLSLWDRGEWWMFLAAQAMALGTVGVRSVIALGVDPVVATGWHCVLGGAPLLVLSLATEPGLYARLAQDGLPPAAWAQLCYASLFGGALAYALFFVAASKGSLTKLSSLTFLTPSAHTPGRARHPSQSRSRARPPVFAAAAGYATMHETLSPVQCGGALVTLLGVTMVNTRPAPDSSRGADKQA